MQLTGGQALARQLVLEGITDLFGVPGVQLDWAVDGLREVSNRIRYVVTRHEPHDGPQSQIVALLRGLFDEEVLAASVWKSTAIADAGLTKQSLYELERGAVGRATFDRAIESLEAVNNEILGLIHKAWGRAH